MSRRQINFCHCFKRFADRVIRGERILISRPKNENLVVIKKVEYNELEKIKEIAYTESIKKAALAEAKEAVKAMQEQSSYK